MKVLKDIKFQNLKSQNNKESFFKDEKVRIDSIKDNRNNEKENGNTELLSNINNISGNNISNNTVTNSLSNERQQDKSGNNDNTNLQRSRKELKNKNLQQPTFIFLTGLFLSEFAETIASISFSDPFFLADKKEDIIKEYDDYIELISKEDDTGELELAFRELKSSVFSILNTEQKEQKQLYVKEDTDIFNFLYKTMGNIDNLESIIKTNNINDCLNLKASTIIKV